MTNYTRMEFMGKMREFTRDGIMYTWGDVQFWEMDRPGRWNARYTGTVMSIEVTDSMEVHWALQKLERDMLTAYERAALDAKALGKALGKAWWNA